MSNTIKPAGNAMIDKLGDKLGNAKETQATGVSQRIEAKSNSAGTPQNDTVELTSGAKLLERLEKSLDSIPEIDQSRVDAVKQAIASGDYEVDADKIADALLRFDREFGS